MDYKEKYEQAIENIKKIKAANKDNKVLVDFIDYKYPELKESEDERIRKALILYIKTNVSAILGWRKEELIAWLEKQGEQKSTDKVGSKFKAGNWYLCVKDFWDKGVRFDKGKAYH